MRTVFGALALLSACGDSPPSKVFTPLAGTRGGYVTLGSPCTPAGEDDPAFSGFSLGDVTIESESGQPSAAPVCLVYHFQGRVSCPYGQRVTAPSSGAKPPGCTTPRGRSVDVAVLPQCTSRRAEEVVVWSCKCGGAPGESVCDCPSGTSCTPAANDGSYCLPEGSTGPVGCTAECQPGVHVCD